MEDMQTMIDFFALHKRLFLTAHLIGVVVGMGGATIADILFFNFLRDFRISTKEAEVMRLLARVIMSMLGIIYLSGIALFLSDPMTFASSPAFLSKAFIVVILTFNGILMHIFVAPHLVKLSFTHSSPKPKKEFRKERAYAFAMGAVSFTSWYAVFLIAMLKSYLPASTGMTHLVGAYLIVLVCAVCMSQVVRRRMHAQSIA